MVTDAHRDARHLLEDPTVKTELVATFLETVQDWTLGEAAERTGIPKPTLAKMRQKAERGELPNVRQENAEKIVSFLRRRGAWPKSSPGSSAGPPYTGGREGRPAHAIRYFTSPAVARVLGFSPTKISEALFALADEEKWTPLEVAELGEFISAYLRIAQEEAP